MVDIVRTLSCCRGVKASILADRKTWRINSLEGGYLIHYQVNTFPSWATPRLSWAYQKLVLYSESPLAFHCFLLRPPLGGNSHSPLHKNTHSNWQGPLWKLPPVPTWSVTRLHRRTNKSTSWSQISGNKPARKETKCRTRCCFKYIKSTQIINELLIPNVIYILSAKATASPSLVVACLAIRAHIKAYQKSNVWEQRIGARGRPDADARLLQNSIGCPNGIQSPPQMKVHIWEGTVRQSLHSSLAFSEAQTLKPSSPLLSSPWVCNRT